MIVESVLAVTVFVVASMLRFRSAVSSSVCSMFGVVSSVQFRDGSSANVTTLVRDGGDDCGCDSMCIFRDSMVDRGVKESAVSPMVLTLLLPPPPMESTCDLVGSDGGSVFIRFRSSSGSRPVLFILESSIGRMVLVMIRVRYIYISPSCGVNNEQPLVYLVRSTHFFLFAVSIFSNDRQPHEKRLMQLPGEYGTVVQAGYTSVGGTSYNNVQRAFQKK